MTPSNVLYCNLLVTSESVLLLTIRDFVLFCYCLSETRQCVMWLSLSNIKQYVLPALLFIYNTKQCTVLKCHNTMWDIYMKRHFVIQKPLFNTIYCVKLYSLYITLKGLL